MRLQPGYEPLSQAFSGLSRINGGPDDPPMRTGASVCDQGTGMWAVIGALALLQRRQHTGRGGIVATSLLETAMGWNSQKADALVNGGAARPPPLGPSRLRPYEAFDAADAPLLVCCGNDRLFAKLAKELGRPAGRAMSASPPTAPAWRNKAQLFAELVPLLHGGRAPNGWTGSKRAGVPCAPIHSLPEAVAHPQVQALGILQPVPRRRLAPDGLPSRRRPAPAPHSRRAATGRTQCAARVAAADQIPSPNEGDTYHAPASRRRAVLAFSRPNGIRAALPRRRLPEQADPVVVPFAPGSATDQIARAFTQKMRERSASRWWWTTRRASTACMGAAEIGQGHARRLHPAHRHQHHHAASRA